jgi:hypothetical protein
MGLEDGLREVVGDLDPDVDGAIDVVGDTDGLEERGGVWVLATRLLTRGR